MSVKVTVSNSTNSYQLRSRDCIFHWGRRTDGNSNLPDISPQGSRSFGIQGRADSLTGVETRITYDLIHAQSNKKVATIKLQIDKPYDNSSNVAKAWVEECVIGGNPINVTVSPGWGGYGHSSSTVEFKVSIEAAGAQKLGEYLENTKVTYN